MTAHDATTAFARDHAFDLHALPAEERDAIRCVVDCHNAVNEGYARLPEAVLEQDAAVGLLWQLYERCTEQVQGALVAMATACPASSEVLARVSLEATVAIRYILGDRNSRMASYLMDHVVQAERQERQWRKAAEQLQGEEKSVYLAACDYRMQGIEAMKSVVGMLAAQLVSSGSVPSWPNIGSRFEAIGDNLAYRTFYARLCTATHFDAEETLRYVIGKATGPEMLERIAVETVMFSRFMLAEAVRAYAEAGKEYARSYSMEKAIETCESAESLMRFHSLSLSRHVGGIELS
jgi:hypothetical protein